MHKFLIVLILFTAPLCCLPAHAATLPSQNDLSTVVPKAVSSTHEIRPLDLYRLKDAAGRDAGVAFVTTSIPPQVAGYGGEIDMLVGMDPVGRITGVKILGHAETPEFIERVISSDFLRRFIGKGAADAFSDIEAVSGATISSQAIRDDIRTAAEAVRRYLLKQQQTGGAGTIDIPPSSLIGGLGAACLIGLAVFSSLRPKRRWLRTVSMVLAVVVVGVWQNAPVTIGAFVDVRNLASSWRTNLPLLLLFCFAVVAALARGNLYCAYLCPFGALQAGAARICRWKIAAEERVMRSFGWLRWIVLIITVYAIAAAGSQAFRTIEPFALMFARSPQWIVLVQALTVLAVALVVRRVWCRYFCPTGLMLDIIAQVGGKIRHVLRRRRRHEPCAAQ